MDKVSTLKSVIGESKFFSQRKLLRGTTRVFQIQNFANSNFSLDLYIKDFEAAREYLSKASQKNYLGNEIANIANNRPPTTQNKLLQLSPFVHNNLPRVSGRPKRSSLALSTQHKAPNHFSASKLTTKLF